jgi:type IV pilus assembly protein PilE
MATDAMTRAPRVRVAGFNLIELMIVVAVIAILAAIALPSYEYAVRKSRRTDAKAALTDTAQRLERCRTQFGVYNGAGCPLASPFDSAEGYYSVAVVRDAASFTLTATAQRQQASDDACATLTLDHLGVEGATSDGCW